MRVQSNQNSLNGSTTLEKLAISPNFLLYNPAISYLMFPSLIMHTELAQECSFRGLIIR